MSGPKFLQDIILRRKIVKAFSTFLESKRFEIVAAVTPIDVILTTMLAYEFGLRLYYFTEEGKLNTIHGVYGSECIIIADRISDLDVYEGAIETLRKEGAHIHMIICLETPDSDKLSKLSNLDVTCESVVS